MRGLITKQTEKAEDRNLVAMLGLNLVLLAFFIMLTTLSDFQEEKADSAIESINQTFEARLQRPSAKYEQTLAESVSSDQVIDEIGTLFSETLPDVEVVESSTQTALRIILPLANVFPSVVSDSSDAAAPSQALLASRLRAALSRYENKGGTSEITLLYGLGANQTLKGRGNLVTRRLDRLVGVFEEAGHLANQLAVGVEQGYADQFIIVIRLFTGQNSLFEEPSS